MKCNECIWFFCWILSKQRSFNSVAVLPVPVTHSKRYNSMQINVHLAVFLKRSFSDFNQWIRLFHDTSPILDVESMHSDLYTHTVAVVKVWGRDFRGEGYAGNSSEIIFLYWFYWFWLKYKIENPKPEFWQTIFQWVIHCVKIDFGSYLLYHNTTHIYHSFLIFFYFVFEHRIYEETDINLYTWYVLMIGE